MNLFLFDHNEAIRGLVYAYAYGMAFGFIMGVMRNFLIGTFERREA